MSRSHERVSERGSIHLLYGKDRWAFISTKDGQSTGREWHVKAIQRESVVRGVPFLTVSRQDLFLAVTSSVRSRILHKKFHSVRSSPTVLGTTQCLQWAARPEHVVEMAQLRSSIR
ncbi:hypothetical protein K503DRAFT_371993 [Rhizopogon vinicolor AM-OR11-026]|uniref:Uncharacterized protein n=1 Tax=Rhizopogon vinicolor AM-OR11-026 TaxID=1314800 RepID=A0A1B7MRZ9_9AGAM|nr:hypothetical protein K503DRAFT_371993 [Rhizopogon vinicolor AM-OR11-026]